MEIIYLIIGLLSGLLVAVVVFIMQYNSGKQVRQELIEARTGQKSEELLHEEKLIVSRLEADNRILNDRLSAQRNEAETMREQMNNEFRLMANSILEEKSRRFTEINQENIGRILTPLQEKLVEFKQKVEDTYDKESKERFSLDTRIRELVELNRQISQEANNLTKALKGDSKVQGDWGDDFREHS